LHKKLTMEGRAQVRHDCQLWADTLALKGESLLTKQSASGHFYQSMKATPSKHQFFQLYNCDRWHLGEWQTRETVMLEGILRGYAQLSAHQPSRSPSWGCFRGDSYAQYPSFSYDCWWSPQSHLRQVVDHLKTCLFPGWVTTYHSQFCHSISNNTAYIGNPKKSVGTASRMGHGEPTKTFPPLVRSPCKIWSL